MGIGNNREPALLFLGDLVIFALSLFLALLLRGSDGHLVSLYFTHLVPFSFVFLAWTLVFFIAGLYDKYKTILKDKLPGLIFNAELANAVIALAFFYLIPYFGITPKVVLFIDLAITLPLVYIWRSQSHKLFGLKEKMPALIVGSGEDMQALLSEVNANPQSEISFVVHLDLAKAKEAGLANQIETLVKTHDVAIVVIDLRDARIEPLLPHLYNLIFAGVRFIDMYKVYEDVFEREPLSLVRYNWFLENLSFSPSFVYDTLKRFADIVLGAIVGIPSLLFYPFVYLAIKLDDGGSIFISQKRVGKNGKLIDILKFRSMSGNDSGKYASSGKTELVVTNIGAFLRKTRIDELPQVFNVLKGDLSFIGPRPELPPVVVQYEKEIPYYAVRHLIKPGLSGWAQIYGEHAHHGISVEETKNKLSYDLYYVKNRSVMLDTQIALKTISKLLSIAGK